MNNCCFLHILSIMEEHRMKYDAIRKKINALAAVLLAAVLWADADRRLLKRRRDRRIILWTACGLITERTAPARRISS